MIRRDEERKACAKAILIGLLLWLCLPQLTRASSTSDGIALKSLANNTVGTNSILDDREWSTTINSPAAAAAAAEAAAAEGVTSPINQSELEAGFNERQQRGGGGGAVGVGAVGVGGMSDRRDGIHDGIVAPQVVVVVDMSDGTGGRGDRARRRRWDLMDGMASILTDAVTKVFQRSDEEGETTNSLRDLPLGLMRQLRSRKHSDDDDDDSFVEEFVSAFPDDDVYYFNGTVLHPPQPLFPPNHEQQGQAWLLLVGVLCLGTAACLCCRTVVRLQKTNRDGDHHRRNRRRRRRVDYEEIPSDPIPYNFLENNEIPS